jgi:hypothetical protein
MKTRGNWPNKLIDGKIHREEIEKGVSEQRGEVCTDNLLNTKDNWTAR